MFGVFSVLVFRVKIDIILLTYYLLLIRRKLACEYDQMRLTIISFTIRNSLQFSNQIKSNVGFWREGKTGVPGEIPLGTE